MVRYLEAHPPQCHAGLSRLSTLVSFQLTDLRWSEYLHCAQRVRRSFQIRVSKFQLQRVWNDMKHLNIYIYHYIYIYIIIYIYISLYIHQFQTYPDILITPLEPVRTTCQSLKRQTCQLEDRHTADLHGQSGPGPAGSFPKTAMRPGRSRKSPGKATASVKLYEAIWITIESLIMKLKRLK